MLNEVPRSDVPLHHFPGHKVVICKEQVLCQAACCQVPGNMWPEPAHLPICPPTRGLLQLPGREGSEDGIEAGVTFHIALIERGLETTVLAQGG